MAWIKAKRGLRIEIHAGATCRLACCDCGLVHDFIVEQRAGKLTIAFSRNKKATQQRRKAKKEK